MSVPFIGEIRLFGFSRVPNGWFACNGELVSIAEYEVLYTLLGTTYGGDGQTTFGLPDLRGRLPVHFGTLAGGSSYAMGQKAGQESITLTTQQMPIHTHPVIASAVNATSTTPGNTLVTGALVGDSLYAQSALNPNAPLTLAPATVGESGGSLPHDNLMPTQVAQYCIAWSGVYPSQN